MSGGAITFTFMRRCLGDRFRAAGYNKNLVDARYALKKTVIQELGMDNATYQIILRNIWDAKGIPD